MLPDNVAAYVTLPKTREEFCERLKRFVEGTNREPQEVVVPRDEVKEFVSWWKNEWGGLALPQHNVGLDPTRIVHFRVLGLRILIGEEFSLR